MSPRRVQRGTTALVVLAVLSGLRATAIRHGARVLPTMLQSKAMVVSAPAAGRSSLAADRRTVGVARDRLQRATVQEPSAAPNLSKPGSLGGARLQARVPAAPARLGSAPIRPGTTRACCGTTAASACPRLEHHRRLLQGDPGVADTGLEDSAICKPRFGGSVQTGWNGHGSWIGGHIAAALDGTGVNGITPGVKLVALKIARGPARPTTTSSWPPL